MPAFYHGTRGAWIGGVTVVVASAALGAISLQPLQQQPIQMQGGEAVWYSIRTVGGQGPPHISWACAIYEPERRRMLVFGGDVFSDEGTPTPGTTPVPSTSNQLWALNLTPGQETWELLRPKGIVPTARQEAACAYDPPNKDPDRNPHAGRMIVVGGYNDEDDIDLTDTSVLDLTSEDGEWSNYDFLPKDKPSPRQGATLIYQCILCGTNDEQHRVVLYGGYDKRLNQPRGDTWEFSLDTMKWQPLAGLSSSDNLPPPRDGHIAVFDATTQRMIVYGGLNRQRGSVTRPEILDDIWALDLTPGAERWWFLGLGTDVPGDLAWSAARLDKANRRLLAFGGRTGKNGTDRVWELPVDLGAGLWSTVDTNEPRPRMRFGHVMVLDWDTSAGAAYPGPGEYSRLVIFGGIDNDGVAAPGLLALQLSGEVTPDSSDTPSATPTNTATSTSTATFTSTPTRTPAPRYVPLALFGRPEPKIDATPTKEPCADVFEWDDIQEYAKIIPTSGAYQVHTFHRSGDVDWVKFTAVSGQQYTIETVGDLDVDTYIELYDRWGNILDRDDNTNGLNAQIRATVTPGQELYVKIGEFKDKGRCETQTRFGYLVHVTTQGWDYLPYINKLSCQLDNSCIGKGGQQVEEKGDNGSCVVANCLPWLCEGQLLRGTFLPGEDDNNDYYRIEVTRAGKLHIALKTNTSCDEADYDLYLYNNDECTSRYLVDQSAIQCGDDGVTVDVTAGVYYVEVRRYKGGSKIPYSLTWSIR